MADEDWFTSNARHVRFEPLFDEQIKGLGIDHGLMMRVLSASLRENARVR